MNRKTHGATLRAATLVAAIALSTVGLAAACGGTSGATGLLEGRVTLGPITPFERVGGEPTTRPYAATVDIATPEGDVVATVESGNDGTFSLRLAAGSYRLVPRSPQGRPLPYAAPLNATIAAGQTTRVVIAFDTGIR